MLHTKSNDQIESYAEIWVKQATGNVACVWCGSSDRVNRSGRCSHCERIQKNLSKTTARVNELPPDANAHERYQTNWELNIVKEKMQLCIAEGESLRRILEGPIYPYDLEHWFRRIATRIAGKDNLYWNLASPLGETFSSAQRQVLAYLFWQILQADARKSRTRDASNRLIRRSARQSNNRGA